MRFYHTDVVITSRFSDTSCRRLARAAIGLALTLTSCSDAASVPPLTLRVRHPINSLSPQLDSDYVSGTIGHANAALYINGKRVKVSADGAFLAYLAFPINDSTYRFLAILNRDTVRRSIRLMAVDTAGVTDDDDKFLALRERVFASALPGADREWVLFRDTHVSIVRVDGNRILVSQNRWSAWVAARDTTLLRIAPPRAFPIVQVAPPYITQRNSETTVAIPTDGLPPMSIESGGDSIVLVFGNALAKASSMRWSETAPVVRSLDVIPNESTVRILVHAHGPIFGFRVGRSAEGLALTIRRPPDVGDAHPLASRTLIVDAGHPPGGAIGPTGLEEPVVTLAVAKEVARLLRSRGAFVVETRTTSSPVSLAARLQMAHQAGADALVSIHVDAAPSGRNPALMRGSATYVFGGHSVPLAASLQSAMVDQLKTASRGIWRRDFAVLRETWMPSVLCEGALITTPEVEANMRTTRFRARYARGIVDGLEDYFRALSHEWAQ